MPLKLMYITNSEDVAHIAEEAGVDRILSIWNISAKPTGRVGWIQCSPDIRRMM